MPAFICTTRGCRYPNTEAPPAGCLICQDDRQYVNPAGLDHTAGACQSAQSVDRHQTAITAHSMARGLAARSPGPPAEPETALAAAAPVARLQ